MFNINQKQTLKNQKLSTMLSKLIDKKICLIIQYRRF